MSCVALDLGRRYTIAELDDFPKDGRRYELADGWLLVSPMARRLHQLAYLRLGAILEADAPPELSSSTCRSTWTTRTGRTSSRTSPWLATSSGRSRTATCRDWVYEQVAYGEGNDVVAIERPFLVRVVPASLVT